MLTILTGDAIEQLRTLPNESIQCCVTSPPYWGLRDYGTAAWEGGDASCDHLGGRDNSEHQGDVGRRNEEGNAFRNSSRYVNQGEPNRARCKCGAKRIDSQLGLEKTPEEYVAKMVEVFREVRRVLRKDGTLWLNLGDSYWSDVNKGGSGPNGKNGYGENYARGSRGRNQGKEIDNRDSSEDPRWRKTQQASDGSKSLERGRITLKAKDLCGIPWRVAFALQADGWWLRSDIIWAKPNPMPESVTDRPTKAHEYLFLLTKSANYFYDAEAIKERQKECSVQRAEYRLGGFPKGDMADGKTSYVNNPNTVDQTRWNTLNGSLANKRSVWTVPTHSYPEAHFATYPPDLIKPCILAGTSAKGCCAKCGVPWERIVESSKSFDSGSGRAGNMPKGKQDLRASETNSTPDIRLGPVVSTKTLGWQPTCKCFGSVFCEPSVDISPCTVLDPFAGSGTTGMVALELGRKAMLIELNPKYCDLIRQRCDVTPGLQLA